MTTREKVLYLKENGITITHIAKITKCAPQTLNNWIKGERTISARLEEDLEQAIETIVKKIGKVRGIEND